MKSVVKKITLYSRDQHSNIRFWSIEGFTTNDEGGFEIGILVMKYGTVGGEVTEREEVIEEGKAARTLIEQIQSRVNSRMDKKMQTGYVHSIEDARSNKRVNKLGLERPMTAVKYKDMMHRIDWNDGVWIQRKYNGYRCLITNIGGEIIAYSRNGLRMENIQHIIDAVKDIIPDGATLDGELYCHGHSFQTISSWIKKNQPETVKIQYIIYDAMIPARYTMRWKFLVELLGQDVLEDRPFNMAETEMIYSDSVMNKMVTKFIKEGYEGGMLRTDECDTYQDGKKSKSLIKAKRFIDAEFRISRITESKEGWAILHCIADNGKEFAASAPGNMYEKEQIFKNKEKYIGQYANVEYAELTKEGKPFHAVAKAIRNPHSE